ncbi:MAG: hypothetical protein LBL69_00985 [Zoogloeaceae bacterium]|jgi:hypothetical protein|nr:hypothetical protein [Zoogloeaceae bacterium]
MDEYAWIFHGEKADLCTAVFSSLDRAEIWIRQYSVSGMLTRMPVNVSIYDWVISSGYFEPKKDCQTTSKFIQTFTSAYLEHYHYDNGERR